MLDQGPLEKRTVNFRKLHVAAFPLNLKKKFTPEF